MVNVWVDFKAIKETVSLQMVLDHYGVGNLRKSGDELRGPCPIHKGSAQSKNFSVNTAKNAFKCFSKDCGVRGNVLDFVAAMEHCRVREAALKLRDLFKIGERESGTRQEVEGTNASAPIPRGIYRDNEGAQFEVLTTAKNAEDFEPVVVYRELFGRYDAWVAPLDNFLTGESTAEPRYVLVKAL